MSDKIPLIPFEDLARIPFFCTGPGIPKGKKISCCIQSFDFVPTCLEWAGVEPPIKDYDAQSLTPYFEGKNTKAKRPVFSSIAHLSHMVRIGDLKYFRHSENGEEMLLDLIKDPKEICNLTQNLEYKESLNELRKALDEH